MNYQLTAEERETIMLTSDAENQWEIQTSQKKIMTKLNKITEPYKIEKDENGNIMTAWYRINFNLISIRKPIKLSDEERQKRKENALKAREARNNSKNSID